LFPCSGSVSSVSDEDSHFDLSNPDAGMYYPLDHECLVYPSEECYDSEPLGKKNDKYVASTRTEEKSKKKSNSDERDYCH